MSDLIYSPKDILRQEFKNKMRGYDPVEVDEFLDNVIKDYETYAKSILELQEENDKLHAKVAQLSKTQSVVNSRVQTELPKSQTVTNFDILKRLSNLEKEVFGKKLHQDVKIEEKTTPVVTSNYTQVELEDDNERTRQF